jgi:hypothetical protein
MNDFNEVTRYLLNHILKTHVHGGDIQAAMKERKELHFSKVMPPTLVSMSQDTTIKQLEVKAHKAMFKAEIQQFVKQKGSYVSNKGKVYFWCDNSMHEPCKTKSKLELISQQASSIPQSSY